MSRYNQFTAFKEIKAPKICTRTRVQQQFKEECDINNIVDRFTKTGQAPGATKQPFFADLTVVDGLQDALHKVDNARKSFASMPAKVRAKFENNPANIEPWLMDPANTAEARELGLIATPEAPPKPLAGEAVETPAEGTEATSGASSTPGGEGA